MTTAHHATPGPADRTEASSKSPESLESPESSKSSKSSESSGRAVPAGTLRYRWAVDVSAWEPSEAEFSWACSTLILEDEVVQVNKYKFQEDRKRALVSLVLQRTAGVKYWAYRAAGVDGVDGLNGVGIDSCIRALEDVSLGKTKGRKPYIVKNAGGEGVTVEAGRATAVGNADNFNYNVSHDGRFVVLASELYCLCGCDVSAAGSVLGKVGRGPAGGSESGMDGLRHTLKSFEKQLTEREWDAVYGKDREGHGEGHGDCKVEERVNAVARRFAKFWSLKEAYVKAIGLGLGYDLGRLEFEVLEGGRAKGDLSVALVSIDGALSEDWCCYLQSLGDDGDHWVSVARGPVGDVVDALGGFTQSFGLRDMGRDMLNRVVFQEREPSFLELRFDQLIRMGYGDAVHRTWSERFGGG